MVFKVNWLDESMIVVQTEYVEKSSRWEACVFAGRRFFQSVHKVPRTAAGFHIIGEEDPDFLREQEGIRFVES